ncbi:hypothetical protein AB8A20_15665 [Tardiphaga sp. 604_B6_N1_1]|uniref:hypothetical protein n=1 Tax=Tardiphaga sp. 604_B6_N1_1 TaxID=3240779 RepID=UPI003F284608
MSLVTKYMRAAIAPFAQEIEALVQRGMAGNSQQIDSLAVLGGRIQATANADRAPFDQLSDAEFKVFSQYGEDGILQYLIREARITREESVFIEFGVQNYLESCTRFLLVNDLWRGLILDGSKEYMNFVRNHDMYWRYDVTAVNAWIDRDNVNDLFRDAGVAGDIGVLVIDIDGNDYWIWERIDAVNPVIVVVEWNSVFGPDHAVSVPYDPAFERGKAHYSNLFWGASIAAFEHLGTQKGYALVGSNAVGNNIFFVRKDRLGRVKPFSAREAWVDSRFRDSRDRNGKLNFLGGARRRLEILDVPLVEVIGGKQATLRSLDDAAARSSASDHGTPRR